MNQEISISILSSNPEFFAQMHIKIGGIGSFVFKITKGLNMSMIDFNQDKDMDLLLVDLKLDSVELLKKIGWIANIYPTIHIVGVSEEFIQIPMAKYIHAGMSGFISLNVDQIGLIKSLNFIRNRGFYYSTEAAEAMAEQILNPSFQKTSLKEKKLSKNELATLEFLCRGFENHAIATQLEVSSRTIENYRSSITKKLGANSILNAAIKAIEFGIINVEPKKTGQRPFRENTLKAAH